ncbi:hypothetical protein ACEQUB_01158 [Ralstonia syzygii]
MAREGDLTVCPKCKGVFAILRGNGNTFDGRDGNKVYARHGDRTACGAQLLGSQWLTTASDQASASPAEPLTRAESVAAPTNSGVCLECLLKAAATGSATVIRG